MLDWQDFQEYYKTLTSCRSGKESHPTSRFNLNERLYEKKVDPFAQAKS